MTRAATGTPATRAVVALLAARAAFGLAYLDGSLRRPSTLWYRPLARTWSFAAAPDDVAMEWYGRTGAALLAALVTGGLAWLAAARAPFAAALSRPPTVLAAARAVGLMVLIDFAYFGWTMAHPVAAPLR